MVDSGLDSVWLSERWSLADEHFPMRFRWSTLRCCKLSGRFEGFRERRAQPRVGLTIVFHLTILACARLSPGARHASREFPAKQRALSYVIRSSVR